MSKKTLIAVLIIIAVGIVLVMVIAGTEVDEPILEEGVIIDDFEEDILEIEPEPELPEEIEETEEGELEIEI